MLCSYLVKRLQNIVIATLVLVVYAPNVFTRSDEIVKNSINTPNQNASKSKPFEEFFIEHNISQTDARRTFFEIGIKLIDGACFSVFDAKQLSISITETF